MHAHDAPRYSANSTMRWPAALLVALVLSACLLHSTAADKQVLVLLQDTSWKASYSNFFGILESQGFTLDVKGYRDSSLKMRNYDQWHYDHLVIFAPKAEGEPLCGRQHPISSISPAGLQLHGTSSTCRALAPW
jgi:hypothetical protein